ncbi:hypothetical protein FGG08_002427 [Glutinoglossum americanum]|uniref:Uncharacterized protein n=1 Tax=Glutinoglossum americanum TaxID=1670608 RepID=A0A9P8I081_9PEZI|nr:hypothetical protein FGG08_002427 [Glutinoglossum americanum]
MSRLRCVHEPFGDSFYFGPERLSERYEGDEVERRESGFADVTFGDVVRSIQKEEEKAEAEGKRLFIKDIAHYLLPPDGKPASIAPSLIHLNDGATDTAPITFKNSSTSSTNTTNSTTASTPTPNSPPYPYLTPTEPSNPTVLPLEILRRFHWTFLIRHPRSSIPSYYRCTIPPLSHKTGFHNFLPSEAGYSELRRLFEYLLAEGVIGPKTAGRSSGEGEENANGSDGEDETEICLIDADSLLSSPPATIQSFCRSCNIPYDPQMLSWSDPASRRLAQQAFAKWQGFHDDAIKSTGFFELREKRRGEGEGEEERLRREEDEERGWKEMFGEEGAGVVKEAVEGCLEDYEFLKGFALRG